MEETRYCDSCDRWPCRCCGLGRELSWGCDDDSPWRENAVMELEDAPGE